MSKFKPNSSVSVKKIKGPSILAVGMIGRVVRTRNGGEYWRRMTGTSRIVDVLFNDYPGEFPMMEKELEYAGG